MEGRAGLDIRLLGEFSVSLNARPVTIDSRPSRLLLIYLLLHPGPQPREVIIDCFWPETSAPNGRSNLRHALWRLRRALGSVDGTPDYIAADDDSLRFRLEQPVVYDVGRFELSPGDHTANALAIALGNYRGELLPGYYEDWIIRERERLAAVLDRQIRRLLALLEAAGEWDETIRWSRRWLSLEPAPEPAFRALMLAYTAQHRSDQALATYRRACETLRNDFDLPPCIELQELAERIAAGADLGLGSHGYTAPRAATEAGPPPARPGLVHWLRASVLLLVAATAGWLAARLMRSD